MPEDNEFLTLLAGAMHRQGVDSPNRLYRLLKDARPDGGSPARSTVHAWFEGVSAPQPWLVAWARDGLRLPRKEYLELCAAWIETYSS